MNLRYLLILICFGLTSGCASLNVRNQSDMLYTAMTQYGAAYRWGRIREAYSYHIDRDGKKPETDLDRFENFSVTDFKPIDPVVNEDATEAVVPIVIDYYNEQDGNLRKFKDTQHWWFSTEKKRWFVESAFPVFK